MIILYSDIDTHDTILELWGASTKHPDSRFYFSKFEKCEWIEEEHQIFQWILECASKLAFPFHAYELTECAMNFYRMINALDK